MSTSLRARLVRSLLVVLLPVWVAMAAWTYWSVVEEVDEIYDQQLMEVALPLLPQSVAALHESLDAMPIDQPDGEGVDLAVLAWSPQGALLYRSPMAPPLLFAERPRDPAGLRMANTVVLNGHGWRVWWFEQPQMGRWLAVLKPMTERNELARALALGLGLPTLATVLLLTPVVRWVVRRGLRPLHQLGQQIARRRAADLASVSEAGQPSETVPLVQEINALMTRLARTFATERRFTADASHELRTPLAACRAQIEVARGAEEAAVREAALANAMLALDRATRLTDELLALARLDHDTEAPLSATPGWRDELDLAALVQDRMGAVAVAALARGLELSLEAAAGVPRVAGHPEWIAMAVDNLLSNALKYTPSGGAVRVAVEPTEAGVAVVVHDTGPGVRPEDLPKLGDRFDRLGARGEGAGLGLSIVRQVAARHGGRLLFALDDGLRATLILPQRAPAVTRP
ncbi:ATP-binding protein [uncultured Aquabacterium sp.]|uniref:ATP-binding protein n=1 Tax=uncultured Aquabacterium sp. TaxID=158753 RepID=UPI0026198291|nr:ATP-binding protein [uncultured Aquabacterium sp.]